MRLLKKLIPAERRGPRGVVPNPQTRIHLVCELNRTIREGNDPCTKCQAWHVASKEQGECYADLSWCFLHVWNEKCNWQMMTKFAPVWHLQQLSLESQAFQLWHLHPQQQHGDKGIPWLRECSVWIKNKSHMASVATTVTERFILLSCFTPLLLKRSVSPLGILFDICTIHCATAVHRFVLLAERNLYKFDFRKQNVWNSQWQYDDHRLQRQNVRQRLLLDSHIPRWRLAYQTFGPKGFSWCNLPTSQTHPAWVAYRSSFVRPQVTSVAWLQYAGACTGGKTWHCTCTCKIGKMII